MSETVSLEFIGRRLDSVQADVADVRRRMVGLLERFDGIEAGIGRIDRRLSLLETRMDAMVERQSKQEELLQRTLLMTQRIAAKLGVDSDGP